MISANSATGVTFDTGGGGLQIIGASTRTFKTTAADLVVEGFGDLTLKSGDDVIIEPLSATGDLVFNGTNIEAVASSGTSGKYLRILLNGSYYKIALDND